MQIQGSEVALVEPSEALREHYLAFYEEWKASGESFVPWVVEIDPADFAGMLQSLREHAGAVNIKDGWVSSSTFWLVTTDQRVVGAVNIRHWLTEAYSVQAGISAMAWSPRSADRGMPVNF